VICLDYETEAILPRPNYPPKPVSVAIKWPDTKAYELLAWGHPAGNNCTFKEAKGRVAKAHASRYPILCQYGMFDHDVSEVHFGLPLLPWERCHDTMFLAFLHDPHSPALGLKPLAERYLGMKPEEQDRMIEWILANVPEAKRKPSTAGAYIARCPYQIVRPYHKGDLVRAVGLFDYLYPLVIDAGMGEAYDRERRLMPILLRNARRGMRVDIDRLSEDTPRMKAGLAAADAWLRKRLGDINLNSPKQLGEALYSKGIVREFKKTTKGQLSTSKKHLTIDLFSDKRVYHALTYRGQMETSIGTFMESWLELASADNVIHPDWSQVRSAKGDTKDLKGARSGRIICARPNLLNIPKKWKKAIVAGYVHPAFIKGAVELPYIRTYALPHKGKRWGRLDQSQQELRLFAWAEEGPVMEGFLNDPDFDVHENVRVEEEAALIAAGLRDSMDRDTAKNTVFARLYGQGLKGLMQTLKLPEGEDAVARVVQKALNTALPSIKMLDDQLKEIVNAGDPIKTWGGRLYYKEAPKYVEKFGRVMDFAYKMLDYFCQGSGADVTKEVIIRYEDHPRRLEEFIVTVYDEVDTNLPNSDKGARQELRVLNECVESIDISPLTMLGKCETGPSWGETKEMTL
jgi:DNA polymerase I-like protein with 3'-5' exonuclease and polymerase domains